MTKRSGVFVEKLFYNIIAYTHENISLKNFLCQCAHIPWNLIVSIGREYMADPVMPINAVTSFVRKDFFKTILLVNNIDLKIFVSNFCMVFLKN